MGAEGAAEQPVQPVTVPTSSRSSRQGGLPFGALLLVVLAATLPYLNSFGHDFVRDDEILIRDNPAITSFDGLVEGLGRNWWGDRIEGGLWRPVVLVSWWANHAAGGFDTFGYTAVDLLIHLAVTLALVALARSLGASVLGAVLAGLLFGSHPVHVEAVTGFVGRADTLATLFVLLALIAHRAIPVRGGRARLAAALCFLLALLSKESAFALLVLLPAMDWLCPSPGQDGAPVPLRARLLRDHMVYATALALVLLARSLVLGGLGREVGTIEPRYNPLVPAVTTPLGDVRGANPTEALLTPIALVGESARLLLWPERLSADYSHEHFPLARSFGDRRVAIGALLVLATAFGAWRRRRTAPAISLGLAMLGIAWLITGNVFFRTGTLFAERLLYLPSAGAMLALGVGLARLSRAGDAALRSVVLIGSAVAVLALGGRTWARNPVWQDSDTITLAMVEDAPDSFLARSARGIHLALHGDHQAAGGEAALARRMHEQALAQLLASVSICPEHDPSNRMLVSVYWSLGRLEEALPIYARLAKLAPDDAYVLGGWASTLITLGRASAEGMGDGRFREARDRLDSALLLDPLYTDAWVTRGLLLRDAFEDPVGAAADLRRALLLAPDHADREAIEREATRLEGLELP